MAKRKYISADKALGAGLNVEVAPYDQKEVVADKDGKFLGQNGTTLGDLNMVGTGEYINATNYDKMGPSYAIVTNPYQAASPDQIAQRQQAVQKSTSNNDIGLMGDDSYNIILAAQKGWADTDALYQDALARGAADEAAELLAIRNGYHTTAEAERAKYGYSGGVDGSEHLGLMVNTAGLYDDEDERESNRGNRGDSYLDNIKGGFSYETAPQYVNRYQQQIDALTQAIIGRQPFSYDPETDPTYQQYKADYTRMGQQAMQDTLAQVAARTGGIASSYGVGASQQAFNNYMAQLASKVPELRQLAYSMYMDDLNSQRNDLNMLMGLEQGDYGKYLDQLGQWNTDRNFDYGAYRDTVSDNQWNQSFDYQQQQDALAQQNYLNEFAYQQQMDKLAQDNYLNEFAYQQQMDKLAQDNYLNEWNYQLQQDALARQDALNKLLSGSGGGSQPEVEQLTDWESIQGMRTEAEVIEFLKRAGYDKSEREDMTQQWRYHRYSKENNGWKPPELDGNNVPDGMVNVPNFGNITFEEAERLEEEGAIVLVGMQNGMPVYSLANKKNIFGTTK